MSLTVNSDVLIAMLPRTPRVCKHAATKLLEVNLVVHSSS